MDQSPETTDIFLWANNTDAIKNELDFELFLFNKNYTPYSTNFSDQLNAQIKSLFLFDYINFIQLGAGTGLAVRDFETSQPGEDVLHRIDLNKVGRAETLVHLIEHERSDIVQFSEAEHEFKRIKGMVARFCLKSQPQKTFYSFKSLQSGAALKSSLAWQFDQDRFSPLSAEFAFKVPADKQVLIINQDIFIFNQSKFEKLFNVDFKKQLVAEQRAEEIEQQYKLSFADGLDFKTLLRDKKALTAKLQKLEVGQINQQQALDYADQIGIDLMTDDHGAIIILDATDLLKFVNLINEDYVFSQITGKRYEIKTKKLLQEFEGEPPRG